MKMLGVKVNEILESSVAQRGGIIFQFLSSRTPGPGFFSSESFPFLS